MIQLVVKECTYGLLRKYKTEGMVLSMSKITNNVSKMMSVATSDMPVYVVNNEELYNALKNGWEKRDIQLCTEMPIIRKGLVIIDDIGTFMIKFEEEGNGSL